MAKIKYEMVGKKFGKWLVLGRATLLQSKNKTRSEWICVCECGTEKVCDGYYLRKGKTKSCGCGAIEESRLKRRIGQGLSGRNQLFLKYKIEARNRKLSWGLSLEEFSLLTKQNCYYCNQSPHKFYNNNGSTSVEAKEYSKYLYNGIDRKDNSDGYMPENSVTCCWKCNKMKGSMGYDTFINTIKEIFNNLKEKV